MPNIEPSFAPNTLSLEEHYSKNLQNIIEAAPNTYWKGTSKGTFEKVSFGPLGRLWEKIREYIFGWGNRTSLAVKKCVLYRLILRGAIEGTLKTHLEKIIRAAIQTKILPESEADWGLEEHRDLNEVIQAIRQNTFTQKTALQKEAEFYQKYSRELRPIFSAGPVLATIVANDILAKGPGNKQQSTTSHPPDQQPEPHKKLPLFTPRLRSTVPAPKQNPPQPTKISYTDLPKADIAEPDPVQSFRPLTACAIASLALLILTKAAYTPFFNKPQDTETEPKPAFNGSDPVQSADTPPEIAFSRIPTNNRTCPFVQEQLRELNLFSTEDDSQQFAKELPLLPNKIHPLIPPSNQNQTESGDLVNSTLKPHTAFENAYPAFYNNLDNNEPPALYKHLGPVERGSKVIEMIPNPYNKRVVALRPYLQQKNVSPVRLTVPQQIYPFINVSQPQQQRNPADSKQASATPVTSQNQAKTTYVKVNSYIQGIFLAFLGWASIIGLSNITSLACSRTKKTKEEASNEPNIGESSPPPSEITELIQEITIQVNALSKMYEELMSLHEEGIQLNKETNELTKKINKRTTQP